MRRDLPRLAMALLMSLWLGMLVPGHQGHAVVVGGHDRDHAIDGAREAHGQEGGHPESQHDHSRCAICLFALTLTPPPVIDCDLSRHDRVAELPPTDVADLIAAEFPTFHSRGPPTA